MIEFCDKWMVQPFFKFLCWLFVDETKKEMKGSCTCALCRDDVEFEYISKNRYDFFSEMDKLKSLGWKPLWIVKGNFVCPECIFKLKRGLVPGVGVVLVTEEMFEKGKAFPVEYFEEDK